MFNIITEGGASSSGKSAKRSLCVWGVEWVTKVGNADSRPRSGPSSEPAALGHQRQHDHGHHQDHRNHHQLHGNIRHDRHQAKAIMTSTTTATTIFRAKPAVPMLTSFQISWIRKICAHQDFLCVRVRLFVNSEYNDIAISAICCYSVSDSIAIGEVYKKYSISQYLSR